MAMNKRSLFFTITSIVLVSALFVFYITSNRYSEYDSVKVVESRVLSMDNFIKDIEHDIVRGLDISTIRSFIGMAEYLTKNGTYFEDFDAGINEIIFNGTINGVTINTTKDANFGDWIDKIKDIGEKLDIEIEFDNLSVHAYHLDPWTVELRLDGIMNITDKRGLANWQRQINLTSSMSIIGFEDPLYTVKTKGDMINKIVINNETDFVTGTDASNLILHANSSMYIASTSAPSFLMRYKGNLSPSPYGIESIINIPYLQLVTVPGIYHATASSIDYIHFGNYSIPNCQLNQTKDDLPWLRLDDPHLAAYEASCS